MSFFGHNIKYRLFFPKKKFKLFLSIINNNEFVSYSWNTTVSKNTCLVFELIINSKVQLFMNNV